MTKTQQKQIDEIARRVLRIETLAERKSDELDFYDLSVWQIERALNAAYEAGRREAAKKTTRRQRLVKATEHLEIATHGNLTIVRQKPATTETFNNTKN